VRLVVPDRPGYGRSSPPPRGWTREDWRGDPTELLEAESIDRAAVLGFSGGGPFALAAADSEWASRLGLVNTVVPPSDTGLARLAKVPWAVRVLVRLAGALASVTGPETIAEQYTDRSVSEAVVRAIAGEFHEALRQGARAVERESRSFATDAPEPGRVSVSLRVWHGTRDENAPLASVRAFVDTTDGTLVSPEADHLGTLLDRRRDALGDSAATELRANVSRTLRRTGAGMTLPARPGRRPRESRIDSRRGSTPVTDGDAGDPLWTRKFSGGS